MAIDTFKLRNNLGHLIRRSHQRVAALYTLEIGRELPSPQFSVLLTVAQNPGLAQIDLINLIGIDRSTISSIVQRLVRRKMLTRTRHKENQRTDALFITDKGVAAVEAAIPGANKVHRRVVKIVPPSLLPAFVAAVKVLADWPVSNGGSSDEAERQGVRRNGRFTRHSHGRLPAPAVKSRSRRI